MADNPNLMATLARSGRMRIAAALVVTALVGGGLGVIMLRGDAGGKAPLFTGLDVEEAGDIAARLDTANIAYTLEGGGSSIFVDRSKIDAARMMLAEQGLPTKGSVGWEIFDKTEALGQTSFVQNVNKVRALQGELERTIASLDNVKAARVHLAIPDRQLFQKDSQKPTASVILQLTGSMIPPGTVRGIQNIVALSVPGLKPEHVSVADDRGRLLASGAPGDSSGVDAGAGDERRTAMEDSLRQKVVEIVENIAGVGAAKVTVALDVDFNRVTQTNETFDPDSRVLRSSTTREESSQNSDTEPGDTASVAQNVPTGAAPNASPSPRSQAATTATSETVNYEISKSVRTEIMDGGGVKRLSVAVAVDHVRVPGAEGAPATYNPRTPEELAQILQLVRSAVGFNEQRGDVVTVENVPFARPEIDMGDAKPPGAFDFDKFDVVRGVEIGALLITALALVFFVLGPLVRGLMSKDGGKGGKGGKGSPELEGLDGQSMMIGADGQPMAAGAAGGGQRQVAMQGGKTMTFDIPDDPRLDAGIDVARISGQVKASSIKKISEVVSSHPDESLAIIRSWLAEEGRAA